MACCELPVEEPQAKDCWLRLASRETWGLATITGKGLEMDCSLASCGMTAAPAETRTAWL